MSAAANGPASAASDSPLALILDPASRPNPYPLYRKLRERPVWRGADGSYVIGRYRDVVSLIRDPRLSADPAHASGGGAALSFLNMDPPDHDRVRRMTTRHFGPPNSPNMVEGMTPLLETLVRSMIDKLADRSEFDVVADISNPFPGRVIADLLGVPASDEDRLCHWAEAIAQATDRDPGHRSDSAERAFHELAGYMARLIAARRAEPRDDMLSRLVNDNGPEGTLRTAELIQVSILLLLAGHETTVNLISNGMLTLLRHPDVLQRLREEPDIAPFLVEELLRYEPPVHIVFRGTLCDLEVDGVHIPGGSSIHLMLGSANRDPERFDDPDLFLPDRRDNQHLGFGSGIHNCFGAPLARLEVQIALRELARRLVSPRLVEDPPPYRFNPNLRGPRQLRVAIDGVVP